MSGERECSTGQPITHAARTAVVTLRPLRNCAARRSPAHSISMVSPGLSQTGGSALGSFLTGVPVEMMSPGLSVMNVVDVGDQIGERKNHVRRRVVLRDLAVLAHVSCNGLLRSTSVSIQGPMLPVASKFLPWVTLNLPCRIQSRIVPSLHSVTPAITLSARSFGHVLALAADHDRDLALIVELLGDLRPDELAARCRLPNSARGRTCSDISAARRSRSRVRDSRN